MDWRGEGILLSSRPHGESAAIIRVFTAEQGVHAGVVRGGAGRKMAAVLQPGAQLALAWRARLEDHVGAFTVEPLRARAALMLADADRLAALASVCALLVWALPERDPHPGLYGATVDLLDRLAAGDGWLAALVVWELRLLDDTGYGLDLTECAVTGATEGLAFVSPRTGRAVTRAGAGDLVDRLLPIPPMLHGAPETRAQAVQGLALSGHFLAQGLAAAVDRPVPQARQRLVDRLTRP
jgi:DNA repair protein RecO (recombination protein O)